MINAATAKKLNNSIVANMGLIGSTIQMGRSNEPDQKAVVERIQVEQRAITSLLVSVVDYLSRLDQSLKTQTKITRLVYNQQVLSQREQATETRPATREQPDAVPVAANDNQEEKTGSALGALASGLLIGATALLFANYKTIMDKLKSAASMLGLGADVAAQQTAAPSQTTDDLTSSSPTVPPPPVEQAQQPAMPGPATLPQSTGASKPVRQSTGASKPVRQSTGASKPVRQSTGGSTSVPIQANRVTAPSPISSAPVAVSPARTPPAATPNGSNYDGLRLKSGEAISGGPSATKTVEFAKIVQAQVPELKYFSAFSDSYHKGFNSKHNQGLAFDFSIKDPSQSSAVAAKVKATADANGYKVKIRDEYKDPSGPATGGHIHVTVLGPGTGSTIEGGSGLSMNEGMLGSEGFVAQSLESVQQSLSRAFEHLKPTNMMTRKIGREALQREKDIMAKPPSTGSQQGHFSKPQGARIPSPVQQSVAATGVDVTSQYMFMFFGERPQSATVGNLTQSR